jgi:hypothetical protein
VARAKRTDRAEARRRYRQAHLDDIDGAELDDEEPKPARPARPTAPTERPSITAAFRNAYHRANIREDIAALPSLLPTRAFASAIALVAVGTIAIAAAPENVIAGLAFQALVIPPAMAPIFIVGFFARRASYLLGLIISLVDVLAYVFVVYAVAPALSATPMTADQQQQLVYSAISVGPLSGIFFAAAAAWYRRFLSLSNTNAQRARQGRPRAGRPARS